MSISRAVPIALASAIANDKCAVFVGAGLSCAAGLPDWGELTARLSRAIHASRKHDYLTIAQAYEYRRGRDALLQRVRSILAADNVQPTDIHRQLVALGVRNWVTTNYDDIIEQALRAAGTPPATMVRNGDYRLLDHSRPIVRKLHGDLSDPGSMVVTKNDYWRARCDRDLLWGDLKLVLAGHAVLFLGYGFGDPDFVEVQIDVFRLLAPDPSIPCYAVVFAPDQTHVADLASRRVTAIDLGARPRDEWGPAILEFLGELQSLSSSMRSIVAKRHDGAAAAARVPTLIQEAFRDRGLMLTCCVESLVYWQVLDDGMPLPGYSPERQFLVPWDARVKNWTWEGYERWNEDRSQMWVGVACAEPLDSKT